MSRFNSFHQILSGIVHTLDKISIALSVGSPLHDDLVKAVGLFEIAVRLSVKQNWLKGRDAYRMSLRSLST